MHIVVARRDWIERVPVYVETSATAKDTASRQVYRSTDGQELDGLTLASLQPLERMACLLINMRSLVGLGDGLRLNNKLWYRIK